jgi:TatA/E family protein of Tat protein translocase
VFSLSPIKIMVIVAVILLLLGPDKLPEVAQKLGSWWRALKNIQERVETEVRQAIPDLPSSGDLARLARSPVNLLNQLADRVDAKETEAATTNEPVTDESPLIVRPAPAPSTPREPNASTPPDPSMN